MFGSQARPGMRGSRLGSLSGSSLGEWYDVFTNIIDNGRIQSQLQSGAGTGTSADLTAFDQATKTVAQPAPATPTGGISKTTFVLIAAGVGIAGLMIFGKKPKKRRSK